MNTFAASSKHCCVESNLLILLIIIQITLVNFYQYWREHDSTGNMIPDLMEDYETSMFDIFYNINSNSLINSTNNELMILVGNTLCNNTSKSALIRYIKQVTLPSVP